MLYLEVRVCREHNLHMQRSGHQGGSNRLPKWSERKAKARAIGMTLRLLAKGKKDDSRNVARERRRLGHLKGSHDRPQLCDQWPHLRLAATRLVWAGSFRDSRACLMISDPLLIMATLNNSASGIRLRLHLFNGLHRGRHLFL